jgi:hypothetical protein
VSEYVSCAAAGADAACSPQHLNICSFNVNGEEARWIGDHSLDVLCTHALFAHDRFNLRLQKTNKTGYRAAVKKGLVEWIDEHSPDVLCLGEVKADVLQVCVSQYLLASLSALLSSSSSASASALLCRVFGRFGRFGRFGTLITCMHAGVTLILNVCTTHFLFSFSLHTLIVTFIHCNRQVQRRRVTTATGARRAKRDRKKDMRALRCCQRRRRCRCRTNSKVQPALASSRRRVV